MTVQVPWVGCMVFVGVAVMTGSWVLDKASEKSNKHCLVKDKFYKRQKLRQQRNIQEFL